MADSFKEMLDEKLDERIAIVEDPKYESVPEMSKGNFIGAFILAAVLLGIMVVTCISV